MEADWKRREAQIVQSDVSDQERDRLMKEIELEKQSLRNSLNSSRAQQRSRLEERLRAKKDALNAAKLADQDDQLKALDAAQREEALADELAAQVEQQEIEVVAQTNVATELGRIAEKLDSAAAGGTENPEDRNRLM